MFLTPYNRNHSFDSFNPFQAMEEMERRFFGSEQVSAFKTDIRDDGGEYVLEADLPGFRKEDINIDLEDGRMTITAARHSDFEEKDKKGNYIRCERSYGNFSRSFDLSGIDTDAIHAGFENGVLTLHLPKLVETKPASRKLEIQ